MRHAALPVGERLFGAIFLLRRDHSWGRSSWMSFWRARLLSSTVAILAALAWFTSTNHCLLGVVNAGQSTAGSACHCAEHCKTSGAQSQGASAMLSCCQGLLSPGVELTQAKLKVSLIFLGFQPAFLDRLTRFEALLIPNLSAEYDTGPPKENCFVSTVLKRSLPAHAPPLSA